MNKMPYQNIFGIHIARTFINQLIDNEKNNVISVLNFSVLL
jgi:hypothetical protein